MIVSRIIDHNGSPAISIDGKIYPPMMATIRTIDGNKLKIDEEYYHELGKSGIKIFFVICDTPWLKPGAFELFKHEVEVILREVPDAYIMARIGLHPPVSWCENNPDELIQYSDKKQRMVHLFSESYSADYPTSYSLCSEKWHQDAGEALLHTCQMIEALPYGERIIGFFFAAGGTSEWYYMNPTEFTSKTEYLDTGGFEQAPYDQSDGVYGDLSPAFHKCFTKYLKEKYSTLDAFRAAWKDPAADWDNPTIPNCEPRYYVNGSDYDLAHPVGLRANSAVIPVPGNGTNIGQFVDIDKHQDVYDFYRAWHRGTAESIIHFGKLIKSYFPHKLTGAFYGSAGACRFHSMGQIGSVTEILDSGSVDFLASPGVYENRQPGGFTGQRQCFDSYRLKNRIFVVEDDSRTHFENRYYQNYFEMYEMADTLNVLKREFGRTLCNDVHAWWFDQLLGGRRYKDPIIYKLFAKQNQLAQEAYSMDRRKKHDIAFIYDESSYHLISHESNHQMVELFNNYEIDKIGAPSDRYFKTDFLDENMPDYKLYIFINTLCFNEKERNAVREKLRKNHAVALFMYGSGIVDFESETKFSADNAKKIVGMNVFVELGVYRGKFRFTGDHPISQALGDEDFHGDFKRRMWANCSSYLPRVKSAEVQLCPLIYADDPDASILARFMDSKKPAMMLKEQDGYTTIYCGSKYLGCDVIKEVARYAGCHIYCETEDVLYANQHFVTIHASCSGEKVIHLPRQCSVTEVYEDVNYGEHVGQICVKLRKGETKMFRLSFT